jgi:hypothetical protein
LSIAVIIFTEKKWSRTVCIRDFKLNVFTGHSERGYTFEVGRWRMELIYILKFIIKAKTGEKTDKQQRKTRN